MAVGKIEIVSIARKRPKLLTLIEGKSLPVIIVKTPAPTAIELKVHSTLCHRGNLMSGDLFTGNPLGHARFTRANH